MEYWLFILGGGLLAVWAAFTVMIARRVDVQGERLSKLEWRLHTLAAEAGYEPASWRKIPK